MKKIIISAIIAVFLVMTAIDLLTPEMGFFAKVESGNVGVVDYFGDVKDTPLKPGFHVTRYFEHVHPISVRTEKASYVVEAFSSDIQQVTMAVTINYNVSEESAGVLYKRIGMSYKDTLLSPKVQENSKVVVSGYTAEALIEHRSELGKKIADLMREDIDPYGIKVTDVSIENLDFTDAFEAAVEAKQVATQEKQRAKTQQEQATMEAQQEAERRKIAAEAEANVKKINADAEAYSIEAKANAESEANKKIAESLTNDLIEYTQAQNWNGMLPSTYVGSSDSVPIIQANDFTKSVG
jgi:regulator of protease activity HflC (stomatin/prohibitin superfamily)